MHQAKWFWITVVAVAVLAIGSVAQATTYNLKFGAPYANSSFITPSTAEQYLGAGSWYEQYPSTKTEIYVDPFVQFGTSFTVDQIQSVRYRTVNNGTNPSGVDFYMLIYTALEGSDNDGAFYNKRLNSEPYLTNGYVPPTADVWNTWSTTAGANQLTFYDQNNCGNFGFYGAPTLANLQAGAINWSIWPSNPTQGAADPIPKDYGAKTVKLLNWSSGSGWSAFAGFLDAIEVNLTNGDSYIIDLEAKTDPVYVDDSWAGSAPGAEVAPGKFFGWNAFDKIQDGIDNVSGSTVYVAAGTYTLTSTVTCPLPNLVLEGAGAGSTIVKVAQPVGYAFNVTGAGTTIRGFTVEKTDVAGVHNLMLLNANNITIEDNTFFGPDPGSPWSVNGIVSRAMEVTGGLTGLLVQNNTIHTLRQPAYINPGTIGSVTGNHVYGTRGWVDDGANIAFTANDWPCPGNEGADIALLASVNPLWYPSLIALSNGNDNAYISAQFAGGDNGRATSYVDVTAPVNGNGSSCHPFQLVSAGVTNVLATGTCYVAAGTYVDDVIISKELDLLGIGLPTISGLKTGANSATVRISTPSPVLVDGFTITREGNNVTDWASNVKLIGLAVQGSAGNAEVRRCVFTGNRTGIDLNFTSGNYIHNNVLDFNRSGLVLRNQCTNNRFEENKVTNNWTVGILWLASSTEDATGTVFYNNKIEGNWYTQIENRSLTGGIKNFTGNWLGSTILTYANTNGSEPGYAAQIPVAYGGGAVPPGGAVSVRGVGIADIDHTPWLGLNTDTDIDNGTGTFGFQGDFSTLYADDDNGQFGAVARIQEAVNLVTNSTIYLMPGTYVGQVVISGFTNLDIIGSGIGSTIIQPPATSMTHFFPTTANNYAIMSVENSDNVNISDLTVDGQGKGNINYRFIGVAFYRSGGSVETCELKDIRNTPIDGSQHGIGVYGFVDAAPARTINVTGTHLIGFQKGGIALNGAFLTGHVLDCDVEGYGPATFTAMNGVQIGFGATGSVIGTQIDGCSYTPATDVASGVLFYQSTGPVLAQSNTIDECQVGVYYVDAGGTCDDNTITNTPVGTGAYSWSIVADPGATAARIAKPAPIDAGFSAPRAKPATESMAAGVQTITTIVTSNNLDGGGGGTGLEADAYGIETLNLTASNNRIANFGTGFATWEDAPTASVNAYVAFNEILYNGVGLDNATGYIVANDNTFDNTANASDAQAGNYYNHNCWNDWSGVGTYAVGGLGGNIDLNPNDDCGVSMSPNSIVYLCSGNLTFSVSIGISVTDMDAALFHITYPSELTVTAVDAASSNYIIFYTQTSLGAGQRDTLMVNLGVLTGSQSGGAPLFDVQMNGSTSCLSSTIEMIYQELRDNNNNPINVPMASPIALQTDCGDPDVVVNSPASGGFYNVAPVLNLSASDDCDLDAVYYQIDGCAAAGWVAIASGLSGTSYNNAAWMVPGFAGLTEANHCVHFKVADDNGRFNADSCTYSWCFTKDMTAPPAPTALVAAPGHNKVHLSWTNAASDFDHTVVMRTDWYAGGHEYPEYDDNNPEGPYPTSLLTGDLAYSGTGTTQTDVNDISNATRDVYHYAAFTVDAAGNVSVPSAGARATSYWLGDVTNSPMTVGNFDGNVYYEDLAILSNTFGLNHGNVGYENDFDIGPTHNGSPKGIPTTDNKINFEDLAIFAINFDAVTPAGKILPIFAPTTVDGSLGLGLAVEETAADELTVHVMLRNNPDQAKSIRFVIPSTSSGLKLVDARMSEALSASAQPVFFNARDVDGRVDVSLALLGGETAIGGSGELAVLRLKRTSTGPAMLTFDEIDMRDGENNHLNAVAESAQIGSGSPLPTTYELAQNYPNPFNAGTVISYQVPSAGDVSIVVYNVSGQVVKVLYQGQREQGRYTATWDGTDNNGNRASSGLYLYRINAGGFTASRKMILVK